MQFVFYKTLKNPKFRTFHFGFHSFMMQLFANEIKKQEVFQMGKLNEWHNIIPDDDFDSTVLYETICTTLLDENKMEIRRENTINGVVYRWRIINTCNKIALYGYPGQELKIILTDKMQ